MKDAFQIHDLSDERPESNYARYSVYVDLASMLKPDDYTFGNHAAEKVVRELMLDEGCRAVQNPGGFTEPWAAVSVPWFRTPQGYHVQFDSESGGMEFHSYEREGVKYVVSVCKSLLPDATTTTVEAVADGASMQRLTQMADRIHDPVIAQSRSTLREWLVAIRDEAATLIKQLDEKQEE